MKKTVYLFLVSTAILSGCHSGSKPGNTTTNHIQVIDTATIHAAPQQAIDTTVKDGKVIKRYPNGIIKENDYYVRGRRQGECQSFYPSGKLQSDCYFTDGISDGPCAVYYESGEKRYDGQFTKGKPSGTWNFFDDKGKPERTINYGKNGDKTVM